MEINPLFVAPYSEPVNGWFNKTEIGKHLSTRRDRPDAYALEHRHAYDYQLVDWGISLPFNLWVNLPEEDYHIEIVVESTPGSMKIAEYFLKGRRREIVCICAHIDELCNDDLSGCVVAMELMRKLEMISGLEYSYQMLLVPEMFGTLYYTFHNMDKLSRTIVMLNLETLGSGADLYLKKSIKSNSPFEDILRAALQHSAVPFKEMGFFEGYGNDERVFAWPKIGIPGVALQRYPFPEYHTSDDHPGIIEPRYLQEALLTCETFVKILDQNYIPVFKNILPPWLSRNGLYFDCQNEPEKFRKFNNTVLYNINGKNSVLDLSLLSELDFFEVYDYLDKLVRKDFIQKSSVFYG
jgi:aminopeptidase-like protein